jgi:uncharacterized protein (TIGR03083 family)
LEVVEMASGDVWPSIHAEREALAADLDGIDPEGWTTTSLCTDWTVRDVLAHMTATAKMSPAKFFPKLIAAGFSLRRLQAKDIAAERGSSADDTLSHFKAQLDSTGAPPGPVQTMLGEVVVHAEDIRRPLGIARSYPPETLRTVADFYQGSNLIIGTKRRIAGLTLEATDTDWSHGSGPTVTGPMTSLVMAMTGRKQVLEDLSGPGVEMLASRD